MICMAGAIARSLHRGAPMHGARCVCCFFSLRLGPTLILFPPDLSHSAFEQRAMGDVEECFSPNLGLIGDMFFALVPFCRHAIATRKESSL